MPVRVAGQRLCETAAGPCGPSGTDTRVTIDANHSFNLPGVRKDTLTVANFMVT